MIDHLDGVKEDGSLHEALEIDRERERDKERERERQREIKRER